MSSGRFSAFQDSDSDSDEEAPPSPIKKNVHIPSYEDLSTSRVDEETVLRVVYGTDFSKEDGAWGCPKLQVQVRPPDMDPDRIGSELRLSVQLGKQYPYVIPKVELQNVKGLSKQEQGTILQKLKERALELASSGSMMVIEFVQIVEDFLLEHNQDPTMSAWAQMKAREAKEKEEKEKIESVRNKELKLLMQAENSSNNPNSTSVLSPGDNRAFRPSFEQEFDSGSPLLGHGAASTDIERELARQRGAIDAAKRERRKMGALFGKNSSGEDEGDSTILNGLDFDDDDENDDAFDDDDDDDPPAPHAGSSRYQTDFIELGILGRGGGGEVVKVKNRLDRRICT
jgi:translation initiation factor 2-alpha kinase 4